MAQSKGAANVNVADATSQIFNILNGLEADARRRVVRAVLMLIGEDQLAAELDGGASGGGNGGGAKGKGASAGSGKDAQAPAMTAQAFFAEKDPQTKIEELAVAARYREQHLKEESHEKDDFKAVFEKARRNFDASNFRRDIDNAKTAGFFSKGKGNPLAYYGQNYVDALPDREKVKQLQRPRGAGRKKKKAAKAV